MQVLSYLDPKDIASMRASCRSFHRASNSRMVWMTALERVCDQHGIFRATYFMETMTLAELEHAASGPHRFVKWLKASASSTTEPQPYRSQAHRMMKEENVEALPELIGDPAILRLVPGGRYLVTSYSTIDGSCLCLWDLGNIVNVTAKPFPLATLETSPRPGDDDWEIREPDWFFGDSDMEIALSSSGKDILVLGYSANLDPLSKEYYNSVVVYRINPLDTNPLFHKDGVLINERFTGAEYKPQTYTLSDSIAVINTGNAVFVWNWAASTGCTWLLDTDYIDWDDPDLRLCDTVIISLTKEYFYVWDIPDLYPVPAAMCDWLSVTNPAKRFPRRRHGSDPDLRTMPTYQRSLPQHIGVLDDAYEDDIENAIFSMYSVQPTGSGQTSFLASKPPVAAGVLPSPPCLRFLSDLIFCGGHLVVFTTNREQQIVATVLPVPTEASGKDLSSEAAAVPLFQYRGHNVVLPSRKFGFCPMSGRLIHPVFYPSLHILDFLPLA